MRFEGILTSWNDERGFGRIESTQGGEPIFVHVSAWPKAAGRPRANQPVTFEVELGPKGKRARHVQLIPARRIQERTARESRSPRGRLSLFTIPVFALFYAIIALAWKLPLWVAAVYVVASGVTFMAYAFDKSAAARGRWRTQESTLHLFSVAGGWPGALLAQQFLRHKSSKREFRQVFWGTVALNIVVLIALASPAGHRLIAGL